MLEALKWFVQEYGIAIIPTITALFLAWRVAKEGRNDLFDDYHTAIVEMTKAIQEMKTLLDERTRKQDARELRQDARALIQDARDVKRDRS